MKARVALLATLFSLCLVAVVSAQVSTVEGTVVSNSGGLLVINSDSGQKTFMVDAQSSLPADLAVGSRVKVEFHTLANDKFHAFKVTPLGSATITSTETKVDTNPSTTAPVATPESTTGTQPAPATGTYATTTQERTPTTTGNDTTMGTTGTTTDEARTSEERRLPATASPLPLLGLAGSLALAGGALLRRLRA